MAKTKQQLSPIEIAAKKYARYRDPLIMVLHEIQTTRGYIPREAAFEIAKLLNVPLARIYEVITFYNYFRLKSPGKAVISVCTGTACHLKGADKLVKEFSEELDIEPGQTTDDGLFHLQSVRCVGCCGLAPVVVINEKTYGKLQPSQVPHVIAEWKEKFETETADAAS